LDETDSTLKLPFTDDLFTALRSMSNERAFEDAYQRLTFCLLGVATPNKALSVRQQPEDRQITTAQSDLGDGLNVQFPKGVDQALLEEAVPLLLALPDKVIELDLQAEEGDNVVEIVDLTPLAAFKDLKRLDLWHTRISDLRVLETLTALESLDLDNTQVADLTALLELNLSNTQVADLTPIANLVHRRIQEIQLAVR